MNDSEKYFQLGISYYKTRKFDEAIENFSIAIKLNSDYEIAYLNRGFTYTEKKETEKAIVDYNRVIQLNPNNATAYTYLGISFLMQNNCSEAIKNFNRAIELAPNYIEPYLHRSIAYFQMNDETKSRADYKRVMELNFKLALEHNRLAALHMRKGEYEQAISHFSNIIELDINDKNLAIAYSNRGFCYANIGKYDEAIADCNRSLELNPENNETYTIRDMAQNIKNNLN